MTAFVLDCSITMSWCFADEAGVDTDALLDRLRDEGAMVPALWAWEVANVLNMAVRRGRLTAGDVALRLGLLASLPVEVDPDGATRAWRESLALAQAQSLTIYDAAYLELAIRHGADLATRDKALREVATRVGIRTIP